MKRTIMYDIYERRVGKCVIQNMLFGATRYTPDRHIYIRKMERKA